MSPKFSSLGAPEAVAPFQVLGEPEPFSGNQPTSEPGSSQPPPASTPAPGCEPGREGPGLCRDPVLPSWQWQGDSFGQPHVAQCRDPALHTDVAKARAPRSGAFRAYHDHWSRRLRILLSQLVAVFKIE